MISEIDKIVWLNRVKRCLKWQYLILAAMFLFMFLLVRVNFVKLRSHMVLIIHHRLKVYFLSSQLVIPKSNIEIQSIGQHNVIITYCYTWVQLSVKFKFGYYA